MKEALLLHVTQAIQLCYFIFSPQSNRHSLTKGIPPYNLFDYIEDVYPFLSGTNALLLIFSVNLHILTLHLLRS